MLIIVDKALAITAKILDITSKVGIVPQRETPTQLDGFVDWYNTEHLHSEIRFVTPDDRHYGREIEILNRRERVYTQARQSNPNRWTGSIRNWKPVAIVRLNPEKKRPSEEDLYKEAA